MEPSAAELIEKYNKNMKTPELSHLDESGQPRMVDVGSKAETERMARARARVFMAPQALERVLAGTIEKGNVSSVAELAGVMAAKRTHELIPLCHPLSLTHVDVRVDWDKELPGAEVQATCRTRSRTGVEMEALTAVAVAALTIYDMIKSVDKAARISDIRLVEKRGGKSGDLLMEEGAE
jgi:cyclic pyranopterin phosphate synthase